MQGLSNYRYVNRYFKYRIKKFFLKWDSELQRHSAKKDYVSNLQLKNFSAILMTTFPNVKFPHNLLSQTVPFLFPPPPIPALKTTSTRHKIVGYSP